MNKENNILIQVDKNGECNIKYIGYYKMLDKITELMNKSNYNRQLELIEYYIQISWLFREKTNE